MTTKYVRTAGGNSNTAGTYALTSAGTEVTTVPTATDEVVLDANSGQFTISGALVCRSLNCTGYTNTLTHGAFTLSIGDATAGTGNTALKFVAGMTYTANAGGSSEIMFVSSSATQQTIAFASKTLARITFNGTGSWQLADGATLIEQWRVLAAGAFDANSQTITLTQPSCSFQGGGKTYSGTVAITPSAATSVGVITGSNSFNNLTITGPSGKAYTITLSANQTVTGTLTSNGNSILNRVLFASDTFGVARTITLSHDPVITNANFRDITGAGAGSWNLSAITGKSGDCGGNSGITFTTPVMQTWNGTLTGLWSTNAWTTRVPLPQDNVSFAVAFTASQSVTLDMPYAGTNIDWTGATGTPAWVKSVASAIIGNVTMIAGMTNTGVGAISIEWRSTGIILLGGNAITNPLSFPLTTDRIVKGGGSIAQRNFTGGVA